MKAVFFKPDESYLAQLCIKRVLSSTSNLLMLPPQCSDELPGTTLANQQT